MDDVQQDASVTNSSYELALLLDRVMRNLEAGMFRNVPHVDPERIGPLGCMIMTRLADIAPTPIHRLVELMGRDSSQMTRSIRALESKGLIIRRTHPEDRRVSMLSLSDKGEAFVAQLRRVLSTVVEEVLAPLSDGDKAQLTTILSKL